MKNIEILESKKIIDYKFAINYMEEKLLGVKGVSNLIKLKNNIQPSEVKNNIKKAFQRMADIDANNITLETHGNTMRPGG